MKSLVVVAAICVCVSSCAPAPRARPSTSEADSPALVAARALVAEVVPLAAELIRTAPVNPPGGEGRVVRALVERLRSEPGIVVETEQFGAPEHDRWNLLARVPGRDPSARPVVLVGHSDVVPAERADWSEGHAPFDGAIVHDRLVGRGALDMLSMLALEALTLIALARADTPPSADVLLLVAGDEETAGEGMRAAMVTWGERLSRARVALNEGGFIVVDRVRPGTDAAFVSVAEKGFVHIELVATGAAGHGSMPRDDDAPARLARAIARVLVMPHPFRITRESAATFAALGRATGGVESVVLQSERLTEALAKDRLESDPETRAIVHDTCALTVLDAGEKTNVIPTTARARFDCRILPGTDPVLFFDEILVAIDDPRVRARVLASSRANGSPVDHPFLDVVSRALFASSTKETVVVPLLSRGFTDSRFLRAKGVPTYGLVPVRVSKDDVARMHGVDESVETRALEEALPFLVRVVEGALALDVESR